MYILQQSIFISEINIRIPSYKATRNKRKGTLWLPLPSVSLMLVSLTCTFVHTVFKYFTAHQTCITIKLFVNGLFKNAVRGKSYVASNVWMIFNEL
jgi:hypothetical protein